MAEIEKEQNQVVKDVIDQKYEYGFTTDVHTEIIEKGLNEDVVRLISQKKGEPDWMLEFRLKAYNYWKTLKEPKWGHVHVPPIDYQEISYYADPLAKKPKTRRLILSWRNIRQTRYSSGGASGFERYRCRCHHGLCVGEDYLQGETP